jgi:hypothetical protein
MPCYFKATPEIPIRITLRESSASFLYFDSFSGLLFGMAHDTKQPTMVELLPGDDSLTRIPNPNAPSSGELRDGASIVKKREQKKQFDSADYFMAAEKAKNEANSKPVTKKKVPPHLREK